MAERWLNRVVSYIELVVAGILVILVMLAVVGLIYGVSDVIRESIGLTPAHFSTVIELVLEVFILIELFRIAIAYMVHRNVIPTVLEAAIVAVARKFVVLEPKSGFLPYATGLALLLISVAVSWWLLTRASTGDNVEPEIEH